MIGAWLESLEPRERWVLVGGAVGVAVILAWTFVWTPVVGGAAELRQEVAAKQRLLVNLQRVQAIPAAAPRTAAGQGTSLLVLIEQTQRAHGLTGAITRTQPEGNDAISISFQNAVFDDLLAWLITLNTEHGVAVETAQVSGTRAQGLVTGQLSLRR